MSRQGKSEQGLFAFSASSQLFHRVNSERQIILVCSTLIQRQWRNGFTVAVQDCQYRENLSSVVRRFFVRRESMQNRGQNRKKEEYFMNRHVCFYVPQHVLENIARYRALEERGDVSKIRRSIQISEAMRQSRRQSAEESLIPSVPGAHGLQPGAPGPTSLQPGGSVAVAGVVTIPRPDTHARLIYDDHNQFNFDVDDVRNEGDPAILQENANLAYDSLGAALKFYRDLLGRDSLNNLGLNLNANVNYDVNYNNAFWDGTRMVCGNGAMVVFRV